MQVWENLTKLADTFPVAGNKGGSYLTMFSKGGFVFGIINIIGAQPCMQIVLFYAHQVPCFFVSFTSLVGSRALWSRRALHHILAGHPYSRMRTVFSWSRAGTMHACCVANAYAASCGQGSSCMQLRGGQHVKVGMLPRRQLRHRVRGPGLLAVGDCCAPLRCAHRLPGESAPQFASLTPVREGMRRSAVAQNAARAPS